ncbi:hypothetical protein [Nonomuraea sp. NPDC050783]|uniref:hypothetical protein n=1 Tax=Nonomuraea sp. NPDC050783 TaxID=3154634 RepID=UPI003465A2DF
MALAIPIMALVGLMLMQVLEETLLPSSSPASGPRIPQPVPVEPVPAEPAPAEPVPAGLVPAGLAAAEPVPTEPVPTGAGASASTDAGLPGSPASTPRAQHRRPSHRTRRSRITRPRRIGRRALHHVLPRHGRHAASPAAPETPVPSAASLDSAASVDSVAAVAPVASVTSVPDDGAPGGVAAALSPAPVPVAESRI